MKKLWINGLKRGIRANTDSNPQAKHASFKGFPHINHWLKDPKALAIVHISTGSSPLNKQQPTSNIIQSIIN